ASAVRYRVVRLPAALVLRAPLALMKKSRRRPAYHPGGEKRPMSNHDRLGGIIHTYQKFDPVHFPSPTAPPPDLVSPAFEHLLFYGSMRRLTPEELARAVRIDP